MPSPVDEPITLGSCLIVAAFFAAVFTLAWWLFSRRGL